MAAEWGQGDLATWFEASLGYVRSYLKKKKKKAVLKKKKNQLVLRKVTCQRVACSCPGNIK